MFTHTQRVHVYSDVSVCWLPLSVRASLLSMVLKPRRWVLLLSRLITIHCMFQFSACAVNAILSQWRHHLQILYYRNIRCAWATAPLSREIEAHSRSQMAYHACLWNNLKAIQLMMSSLASSSCASNRVLKGPGHWVVLTEMSACDLWETVCFYITEALCWNSMMHTAGCRLTIVNGLT